MKSLILKPLSEQDLTSALNLDQTCFGGLWTRAGYQREIESPNSDLLILMTPNQPDPNPEGGECSRAHHSKPRLNSESAALSPATVVGLGCPWAILEEAHITVLAVDPRVQGQGLGQALLYALLTSAQGRGLERATLEVRASNQSALGLYQKFGFRIAGERPGYYPDGESALILWRSDLAHLANGTDGNNPSSSAGKGELSLQQLWHRQVCDRLHQAGWAISGL